MINDNKNKKLSRKRRRRIERRNKINDDMKLILNKIKSEMKMKNVDKNKHLEILLVRIKYADKPDKLGSASRELNEIQGIDKNLHEIKDEILLDYGGTFEMVGNLKVGDQIKQTHIRFRNINDYENYINAVNEGYDAEDAIFTGYIYKLDTPIFNKVKRSEYGNSCDFRKQIIEYRGN